MPELLFDTSLDIEACSYLTKVQFRFDETYILQCLEHSLQYSQSPLCPLPTLTLVTTLTTLTLLNTSVQQLTTRYNYK